jgi:hypothetical protein
MLIDEYIFIDYVLHWIICTIVSAQQVLDLGTGRTDEYRIHLSSIGGLNHTIK